MPAGEFNKGLKEGGAMQRLFKGLLCFLVLFLIQGCASTKESSSHFLQKTLAVAHLGKNPPEEKQQKVCLLDLNSAIPETTASTAPTEKAPVVQIPETSHDFGTVTEDKTLVHKFSIRNVGKSELRIKKVMPG